MRRWNLGSHLLPSLKEEILDYNRYCRGELKVIGHPDAPKLDSLVRDKFSYGEWIEKHTSLPIIKVEGLEDRISGYGDTVHLFYHQKNCYSFGWHRDDVRVYLYVVRGHKKLYLRDRKINLVSGQGVHIPRGWAHRVFSEQGTWALSIGR